MRLFDKVLENRRMTSWGGILKETAKALQLDDVETGDLIHVEAESEDETANKLADYVTYCWRVGPADYIKTSVRRGDNPTEERKKRPLTKSGCMTAAVCGPVKAHLPKPKQTPKKSG